MIQIVKVGEGYRYELGGVRHEVDYVTQKEALNAALLKLQKRHKMGMVVREEVRL